MTSSKKEPIKSVNQQLQKISPQVVILDKHQENHQKCQNLVSTHPKHFLEKPKPEKVL